MNCIDVPAKPIESHAEWVLRLAHARTHQSPRRLIEPGPTADELQRIVSAATAAPDHGQLTPWRFIQIPDEARAQLAEVFREALIERMPFATAEQQSDAATKAHRSPCLLLAILRCGPAQSHIPESERLISLGCAIQNMLLMAQALDYGSSLSSGHAMQSAALRRAFRLSDAERALCFLSFGTRGEPRPARERPSPHEVLSLWTGF